MSTSRRADREVLAWGGAIFALFAVLVSLFAFVVAASADNGAGAVTGGTPVTLGEFTVSPEMINAPLGGTLVVTNTGSVEHNLAIDGTDLATEMLATGESATLDLGDLEAGAYTVICEVAGHKEAGMTAMLHLGGGGGGSAAAGSDPSSLRAGNDDSDALMKEPVTAYTKQLTEGANTEGVGNRPLSPKILADGTKQFDLTAAIVDWEVAPGQIVKAWAYNGQVPGPWIKVGVGDRVRVVLDNRLPQSTAIHFHGIQTPLAMDGVPDVTQEPIKPGAKFAYEFVAKGPAMGMYHSHHHAEHQVPDGLAGVFQVGDPPLPPGVGPVAQEVPMVLNDAGVIGLTLNGKSFPATAPITAKVGDWVQITYLNEGAQIHPMHLHGLPQMVIGKDGFPLPAPVMMDTVTVAPGERWTVLVRATADFLGPNGGLGVWAFHCHILNHAERSDGMFGMVTTFIVAP